MAAHEPNVAVPRERVGPKDVRLAVVVEVSNARYLVVRGQRRSQDGGAALQAGAVHVPDDQGARTRVLPQDVGLAIGVEVTCT